MPKDIESVTNVPKNCSRGFFRSRYIAKKSSGADPDPGFEMSSGPDPVMNYGRNRVTKFGRIRSEHYGSFYILSYCNE